MEPRVLGDHSLRYSIYQEEAKSLRGRVTADMHPTNCGHAHYEQRTCALQTVGLEAEIFDLAGCTLAGDSRIYLL